MKRTRCVGGAGWLRPMVGCPAAVLVLAALLPELVALVPPPLRCFAAAVRDGFTQILPPGADARAAFVALGSCSQNCLFLSCSSPLTTPGRETGANLSQTLCHNGGSTEGNSQQLVASQGRRCGSQKRLLFLQEHLDSKQHWGRKAEPAEVLLGALLHPWSGAGGARVPPKAPVRALPAAAQRLPMPGANPQGVRAPRALL